MSAVTQLAGGYDACVQSASPNSSDPGCMQVNVAGNAKKLSTYLYYGQNTPAIVATVTAGSTAFTVWKNAAKLPSSGSVSADYLAADVTIASYDSATGAGVFSSAPTGFTGTINMELFPSGATVKPAGIEPSTQNVTLGQLDEMAVVSFIYDRGKVMEGEIVEGVYRLDMNTRHVGTAESSNLASSLKVGSQLTNDGITYTVLAISSATVTLTPAVPATGVYYFSAGLNTFLLRGRDWWGAAGRLVYSTKVSPGTTLTARETDATVTSSGFGIRYFLYPPALEAGAAYLRTNDTEGWGPYISMYLNRERNTTDYDQHVGRAAVVAGSRVAFAYNTSFTAGNPTYYARNDSVYGTGIPDGATITNVQSITGTATGASLVVPYDVSALLRVGTVLTKDSTITEAGGLQASTKISAIAYDSGTGNTTITMDKVASANGQLSFKTEQTLRIVVLSAAAQVTGDVDIVKDGAYGMRIQYQGGFYAGYNAPYRVFNPDTMTSTATNLVPVVLWMRKRQPMTARLQSVAVQKAGSVVTANSIAAAVAATLPQPGTDCSLVANSVYISTTAGSDWVYVSGDITNLPLTDTVSATTSIVALTVSNLFNGAAPRVIAKDAATRRLQVDTAATLTGYELASVTRVLGGSNQGGLFTVRISNNGAGLTADANGVLPCTVAGCTGAAEVDVGTPIVSVYLTDAGTGYVSAAGATFPPTITAPGAFSGKSAILEPVLTTYATASNSTTLAVPNRATGNLRMYVGQTISAKMVAFACTITSGSVSLTTTNDCTSFLASGMVLSHASIPAGATITAVTATTVTMSAAATAGGSGVYVAVENANVVQRSVTAVAATSVTMASTLPSARYSVWSADGGLLGVYVHHPGDFRTTPVLAFTESASKPAGSRPARAYVQVEGKHALNVRVTDAGLGAVTSVTASCTAAVTPTLGAMTLSSIRMTTSGHAHTAAPTVDITGGGGANAAATPVMVRTKKIASVTIVAGGSGYTSAPTVSFVGDAAAAVSATATIAGGAVTAITVVAANNYGFSEAPVIRLTGGGGSGASATAVMVDTIVLTGATITADGINYATAPTVVFTGGNPSVSAVATATIGANKRVTGITFSNYGQGYTSVPTISFTSGTGSGAAATVSASDAYKMVAVTLTNAGSGYTSAPTVTITPAAGSAAEAVMTQPVTGATVTAQGYGFPYKPVISMNRCSGVSFAATMSEEVPSACNATEAVALVNGQPRVPASITGWFSGLDLPADAKTRVQYVELYRHDASYNYIYEAVPASIYGGNRRINSGDLDGLTIANIVLETDSGNSDAPGYGWNRISNVASMMKFGTKYWIQSYRQPAYLLSRPEAQGTSSYGAINSNYSTITLSNLLPRRQLGVFGARTNVSHAAFVRGDDLRSVYVQRGSYLDTKATPFSIYRSTGYTTEHQIAAFTVTAKDAAATLTFSTWDGSKTVQFTKLTVSADMPRGPFWFSTDSAITVQGGAISLSLSTTSTVVPAALGMVKYGGVLMGAYATTPGSGYRDATLMNGSTSLSAVSTVDMTAPTASALPSDSVSLTLMHLAATGGVVESATVTLSPATNATPLVIDFTQPPYQTWRTGGSVLALGSYGSSMATVQQFTWGLGSAWDAAATEAALLSSSAIGGFNFVTDQLAAPQYYQSLALSTGSAGFSTNAGFANFSSTFGTYTMAGVSVNASGNASASHVALMLKAPASAPTLPTGASSLGFAIYGGAYSANGVYQSDVPITFDLTVPAILNPSSIKLMHNGTPVSAASIVGHTCRFVTSFSAVYPYSTGPVPSANDVYATSVTISACTDGAGVTKLMRGAKVQATVTTSAAVTVPAGTKLPLTATKSDGTTSTLLLSYLSGSGSSTIYFEHAVAASENGALSAGDVIFSGALPVPVDSSKSWSNMQPEYTFTRAWSVLGDPYVVPVDGAPYKLDGPTGATFLLLHAPAQGVHVSADTYTHTFSAAFKSRMQSTIDAHGELARAGAVVPDSMTFFRNIHIATPTYTLQLDAETWAVRASDDIPDLTFESTQATPAFAAYARLQTVRSLRVPLADGLTLKLLQFPNEPQLRTGVEIEVGADFDVRALGGALRSVEAARTLPSLIASPANGAAYVHKAAQEIFVDRAGAVGVLTV